MDAIATQSGFDPALIRRYDGRGPRYTSYPTALQFYPDLTADAYAENARHSNARGLPLSLYVHIPFCRALCYYCGCNKIVTRNAERVERYLAALFTEIELQGELFDRARPVEQLHFGGGTPTYLDTVQLARLFDVLHANFSLGTSDDRQFSIEVDPRTVDRTRISELRDLGFNRLSLGIQDFNADVQTAINRIQPLDDVRALVTDAREHGFNSISFDLIYGLPYQTLELFDQTIDATALPSPDTKLAILGRTIERLTGAGYVYIGMDHFALPDDELAQARADGSLQRNFQGYSTHWHCDLVGLGVSSIGSIGNVYAQNTVSTGEYEKILGRRELPVCRGIEVDEDDRIRAAVIQLLMCYDHLPFDRISDEFGIDFAKYFAAELERLEPMERDGLLVRADDEVRILKPGRFLLRNIAMVFDRHLGEEHAQRFSKAI